MHCHGSFSSGNGFIIGMWQCWWNTFGHLSQHISSPPSEQTAHQSSFGSSLFLSAGIKINKTCHNYWCLSIITSQTRKSINPVIYLRLVMKSPLSWLEVMWFYLVVLLVKLVHHLSPILQWSPSNHSRIQCTPYRLFRSMSEIIVSIKKYIE